MRQRSTPTRALIAESWARARRHGLLPEHGRPSATRGAPPRAAGTLAIELARTAAGVIDHYGPAVTAAGALLVISDGAGRILGRAGSPAMCTAADAIGFRKGALWTEGAVGTNAIGTALVTRRPVTVIGEEHFLAAQRCWTCTAAPVRDPRTGGPFVVINISWTSSAPPDLFSALVEAIARVCHLELAEHHHRELVRLSRITMPPTGECRGSLVLDPWGWVARTEGTSAPERVTLPSDWGPGRRWWGVFGLVDVTAVPGGWAVSLLSDPTSPYVPRDPTLVHRAAVRAPDAPVPGGVVLHSPEPVTPRGVTAAPVSATPSQVPSGLYVRLVQNAGRNAAIVGAEPHTARVALTPRQAQLLELVADAASGMSAADLAERMYADPERTVTVRAEVSRLRRSLGPVVLSAPYRLAPNVLVIPRAAQYDEPFEEISASPELEVDEA